MLGQIPDYQRPGVLIPRGAAIRTAISLRSSATRRSSTTGAATTTARKPFLVPYEYRWKPQFVYAPDELHAGGLFTAMRANSTTGDFSKSANRPYLEGYNATRGVYRGTGNDRAAEHPGSLHRRREDRGLDLGQLQGDARLGRSRRAARARAGQSRLHGLHPEHVGLGRGARDPEAAERVPRLEDQPHRPGHRPVRRHRLGARSGAAATAS